MTALQKAWGSWRKADSCTWKGMQGSTQSQREPSQTQDSLHPWATLQLQLECLTPPWGLEPRKGLLAPRAGHRVRFLAGSLPPHRS